MQAIYEVRLEVDAEIEGAYHEWLVEHMPLVVKAGGFVKANLYREETSGSEVVWVCHYVARSSEDIHNYIRDKSADLRADAVSRFGNRFRAQRRILVSAT